MSHPLASTSKPCLQYMAHIMPGHSEMEGFWLCLDLNKGNKHNIQLSRTKIVNRSICWQTKHLNERKKSLKIPKGVIIIRISKKNRQHNGQKKRVQKDKQRSTKHTYKTKDRVTRTPPKTGYELRWSGRVSSSCSASDTRRVNLVTNPVISREWVSDYHLIQLWSISWHQQVI